MRRKCSYFSPPNKTSLSYTPILSYCFYFVSFHLPDDDEVNEAEEDESRDDPNKGSQASKSLVPFLAHHFKNKG